MHLVIKIVRRVPLAELLTSVMSLCRYVFLFTAHHSLDEDYQDSQSGSEAPHFLPTGKSSR